MKLSEHWINDPNFNLPKDRATCNAWARAFYILNPIINSAVRFHAEMPLEFLSQQESKNTQANQFWKEQFKSLQIESKIQDVLIELWVLGEACLYFNLNEKKSEYSEIIVQNPDYVIIKKKLDGELDIALRPDERLRSAVLNDNQELNNISKNVIESIKNKENIKLNKYYVSFMADKSSPYEVRGTSPLFPIFRTMIMIDQIRANHCQNGSIDVDSIETINNLEKQIKTTMHYPYEKKEIIAIDVMAARTGRFMKMITSEFNQKIKQVSKLNNFQTFPSLNFDEKGYKDYLRKRNENL